MAAKLLHSLADDNPDLQKQIGCMTGIFQVFDHQHFVSGRRPNQRRLLPPPSGNSKFSNGSLDADSSNAYNGEAVERKSNKYVNEKQRASMESSRPSFSSSSCSSSSSSLNCGRTGQPELSSMDRIIYPEIPSRDPIISQTNASPLMGRLSSDLRDVVKDSMYKDSRRLSVQTKIKENSSGRTLKHIDSPRPLQLSKSVNGLVGMKGKKDVPNDSKESLRVLPILHDLKEIPMLPYESNEGSCFSMSGDERRFSYDGREKNRKIKELPRLSLDEREGLAGNQTRPSGVVVKLMGLDMMPTTRPSSEIHLGPIKPVQLLEYPSRSRKEPSSPHRKNLDEVMKPISSSKFPIEPAPWKHMDSFRGSSKQTSREVKSSACSLSNSAVYGEVQRRLKDVEKLEESEKDLRALKQILEAMQTKGLFEGAKEELYSRLESMRDDDQKFGFDTNARMNSKLRGSQSSTALESPIVIMKPAKLAKKSSIPPSSVISVDGFSGLRRPKSGEFGAHRKNLASSKMTKDQTVRESCEEEATSSTADRRTNSRNLKGDQSSFRLPQVSKDKSPNSLKNSGSISPRLQDKKLEFDRRSRSPTPFPDSNGTKRQPNKLPIESGSLGGRRRNLMCQEVSTSVHPESDLAFRSKVDLEVTSKEQHVEIACYESRSLEAFKCFMQGEMMNDTKSRMSEEDEVGDLSIAPEQPSPVSVLDSSVCIEESPSPVEKNSHALKGNATSESNENPVEDPWNTSDYLSTKTTVLELPSKIIRKKLQRIDNLVQKLRQLNSAHDESQTDYIASLCENSNPDNRYICEILITSGFLLRDLSNSGLTVFELHPSGHPINPKLFSVLEQTKRENSANGVSLTKSNPQKLHRKLVFDVVNETLLGKLNLVSPRNEPRFKPDKLAKKTLNAQMLLKEVCREIELLQAKSHGLSLLEEEEDDGLKNVLWEDMMNTSDKWVDFRSDISGIVLDVERSIFKELVNEIILGEGASIRGRGNGCSRKLFSN